MSGSLAIIGDAAHMFSGGWPMSSLQSQLFVYNFKKKPMVCFKVSQLFVYNLELHMGHMPVFRHGKFSYKSPSHMDWKQKT